MTPGRLPTPIHLKLIAVRRAQSASRWAGAHKCIGLHVAKMEVRVVMEPFFERVASLELVSEEAVTGHGGTTMGLDTLPIKVTLDG